MLSGPVYLTLIALFMCGQAAELDEHNCDKLGVLLYEEIGCKPLKDKPDDICPSGYNCSHLQISDEFCLFPGKQYKNGESLPDNATNDPCSGDCFCDIYAGRAKFTCAAFDCYEFQGEVAKNSECLKSYELNSCCSVGEICPPFNNIDTCEVDGTKYLKSQKFFPKSACKECICKKGFNGKAEEPFCKRKNCAIQLRHSEDVKNNCAPVYEDNVARCCPFLWVCPEESDIFTTNKNYTFDKTCKFGSKEIKSGQLLQKSVEEYSKRYEVICKCELPPLLTCTVVHSRFIKEYF